MLKLSVIECTPEHHDLLKSEGTENYPQLLQHFGFEEDTPFDINFFSAMLLLKHNAVLVGDVRKWFLTLERESQYINHVLLKCFYLADAQYWKMQFIGHADDYDAMLNASTAYIQGGEAQVAMDMLRTHESAINQLSYDLNKRFYAILSNAYASLQVKTILKTFKNKDGE